MQVEEKVQAATAGMKSWSGGDAEDRSSADWPEPCVYHLTEFERRDIRALCDELPELRMRDLNNLPLWEKLKILSDEMPRGLRQFLAHFELLSNRWGFVIIRGLPIDEESPPTPTIDETFGQFRFDTFAKACALTGARFGYPRAYRDEKGRLVLQPVYPRPSDALKQENSGFGTFLEGHTEDGFLREFCQWLLLGCVRSDHDGIARTGVSCAWRAIDRVEWNVIEALRKPQFVVDAPTSFGGDSSRPLSSQLLPVLSGDPRQPQLVFDVAAMRGLDAHAQEALRQFSEALRGAHVSGVLRRGDCILIDNQTSVHTRSNFRPRFDGLDRLLLRLKVFTNPRSCATNRLPDSLMCGSITFDLVSKS